MTAYLLGKADEIFVVCVHVRKLYFNNEQKLVLRLLLIFTNSRVYDSLALITKPRISNHLQKFIESIADCGNMSAQC